MNVNHAVSTAIEFCKKELVPSKNTALYALGGFLSGRVFGFVSPMHGAIYLASSRITYGAIPRITCRIHQIVYNTTNALSRKISVKPEFKNSDRSHGCSRKENLFSNCIKNGRHLASSWMDSFKDNLRFIRGLPLGYTSIYLSHHMANIAVLSLLKMQPIAYRTAIKVVCSSAVLTIFAGSSIDFATSEIKKRVGGEADYY